MNIYSLLADLIAFLHLAFIIFVLFGGFFAGRFPFLIWVHIPAFIWGFMIEFGNWTCPLTHLENLLRREAGHGEYTEGFIAHHLNTLIYPDWLTPEIQIWLGISVIIINAIAYTYINLYYR